MHCRCQAHPAAAPEWGQHMLRGWTRSIQQSNFSQCQSVKYDLSSMSSYGVTRLRWSNQINWINIPRYVQLENSYMYHNRGDCHIGVFQLNRLGAASPCSLNDFPSQLQLNGNFVSSHPHSNTMIIAKLCLWHNSWADAACVTTCSELMASYSIVNFPWNIPRIYHIVRIRSAQR